MPNNVMNMDGSFKPFRAWCQHVLPLVYDDSLSYMELLNKVIVYINNFGEYLEEFSALNSIKYEGLWDITKQYEAWSVVSYNGEKGYISIQPVPAGVSIENSNYWRLIADFTAEIAGLAERVVALEAEDVVLDGKITTVNERVDTANTNISTLQTNLNTTNNNVTSLTNRVNNIDASWNNRKIIYCGDSYGTGLSILSGEAVYGNPWCYYTNQRLSPNASYNLCTNQAGFSPSLSENLRYGYQLKTFKDNHTTAECEAVTDIVICGGFNEIFYPSDDIAGSNADYCAKWTKTFINTNFPNARVFIGFIGRVPKMSNVANATIPNFNSAIAKYKKVAMENSWKYLTDVEYSSHDYTLLSDDGIHFKPSGYEVIGNAVAEALNNGSYSVNGVDGAMVRFKMNTVSDDTNIAINDYGGLYNVIGKDGITLFSIPSSAVFFNFATRTLNCSLKAYTVGRYIDTATQVFNRFATMYGLRLGGTARVHTSGGGVVANVPCSLNFTTDGEVQIVFYGDNPSYESVSCASVHIVLNPVTLPLSFS